MQYSLNWIEYNARGARLLSCNLTLQEDSMEKIRSTTPPVTKDDANAKKPIKEKDYSQEAPTVEKEAPEPGEEQAP